MWKDITGHSAIVDILRSYCLSGKIPHAFLFAGPQGLGKTRMAKEFFKALNCLKNTSDACDTCASCFKATGSTHPDLAELNPDSRWIKVDDIREILADIGLRPFEARRKCIIIEPAEHLNTESANALLKTLEEPPDNTLIVLISHRPKLLLPTIVSRCQLVRFSEHDDAVGPQDSIEPDDQKIGPYELHGSHSLNDEIIELLRGKDPALLAKKYFDSEGWDILPDVLVSVESIIRDIIALRQGCDKLINEPLQEFPLRQPVMEEIESIAGLIRAMRTGVNENINLRVAATELFIMISRLSSV
jgi:DNA polymerase III delta' subunit